MIGKLSLSAILIATLTCSVNATTYSQEDMDKVLKRLDKLESILAKQQNEVSAKFDEMQSSTDEAIDELYDRADENEFQATMNRIKWGAELEVTDNFISGKTGSMPAMGAVGQRYSHSNQWTTKLRLSMDAKIADNLKFTGRLSMYKNWADSISTPFIGDSAEGRKPVGSSGIYVERAYVDYSPVDFLTVTLGRQPSSDGPGMTLIENTKRKSTYPSLLFDGAADGAVVTANLAKGSSMNPTIRGAYGKGFQQDANYAPYMPKADQIKDLDVFGAFYEMNIPVPAMGDNLLVLSYVKGNNFVGYPLSVTAPNNQNLGSMDLAGIYFENNKFFGTNFNYFASLGWSMPNANGNTVNYGTMTGNQNVAMINQNGFAFHLGARYDFNFGLKLGYEYNQGSKSWYSFTSGSSDLLNKLATRGKVNDMYAIYQIDMYQFLRMGYTMIDYDYTGSGWHIGTPMSTDDYANRFYMLYNLRF